MREVLEKYYTCQVQEAGIKRMGKDETGKVLLRVALVRGRCLRRDPGGDP